MRSVHKDPNVFHFSHSHPLECKTTPPPSTGSNSNIVSCFGCKLKVNKHGENYYQCKTCAFSLHHVCYNMPLITNHPSHPTHDLVFIAIPLSSSPSICVACGNHVTGFCYHCAECSIFFHSLCLALPVSLAITNHPHKIKLEFSPPYDFFCDLCNKPSYKGWLYRCSMCEFDTHIACAVENFEQNPSFPQSSPLLRQLTSQEVEHERFSASVVGDSCKGYEYEIMNLVAQQIGGGIIKEKFDSAVAGWDKRLYSGPRKKHNKTTGSSGKMKIELQEKEVLISPAELLLNKLEERTPLRDNSPFSDSYFSIDLAKSYSTSTLGRRREGGSEHQQITMPERVVSNNSEKPFDLVNDSYDVVPQQNYKVVKEGRTSDFGKSSQRDVVMKNPNESFAKFSVQDQTIAKSESESYSCSCWRNFLTCCL